jgi:hypothetical protein
VEAPTREHLRQQGHRRLVRSHKLLKLLSRLYNKAQDHRLALHRHYNKGHQQTEQRHHCKDLHQFNNLLVNKDLGLLLPKGPCLQDILDPKEQCLQDSPDPKEQCPHDNLDLKEQCLQDNLFLKEQCPHDNRFLKEQCLQDNLAHHNKGCHLGDNRQEQVHHLCSKACNQDLVLLLNKVNKSGQVHHSKANL